MSNHIALDPRRSVVAKPVPGSGKTWLLVSAHRAPAAGTARSLRRSSPSPHAAQARAGDCRPRLQLWPCAGPG